MVPFSDLLALQDMLDKLLVSGQLDLPSYALAWADVLEQTGYTQDQYETELDTRWSKLLDDSAPN